MNHQPRLLLVVIVSSAAFAATARGQEDPLPAIKKRLDTFFASLTANGAEPKAAFDELLLGSPLEKSDDIKKLVDEVKKFDDKYGDFLEAEQVSAKLVGKDLALVKYLYKGQKYPVVWHFAFYRPPSKGVATRSWSVISVRFDTRVDLLP